jgi:hypothetical protein
MRVLVPVSNCEIKHAFFLSTPAGKPFHFQILVHLYELVFRVPGKQKILRMKAMHPGVLAARLFLSHIFHFRMSYSRASKSWRCYAFLASTL